MGEYNLINPFNNEIVDSNDFLPQCRTDSGLLRTAYFAKQLTVRSNLPGLFRFIDWLPVQKPIKTDSCPVTFQCQRLSKMLGFPNLWLTFTGWAPDFKCYSKTGSFKELEAYPTISRLFEAEKQNQFLVIASAGNTGRAFAQAISETADTENVKIILVIPESSISSLWTVSSNHENIILISVSGDYADAISVAEKISSLEGFVSEGGAKNIARRDGMGTTLLDAAVTINRIPDHYFQAVGSGTGGIAAWEASLRLIQDGRFGQKLPKLNLVQNQPFTPMASAWKRKSKTIEAEDMPNADHSVSSVYSPVLTNRKPPYEISGGVFDAMSECGGDFYTVGNSEAKTAFQIFEEETEIDLDPAAAVALAALIQAAENKTIDRNETIVLNLTGGGYQRIREELGTVPIEIYEKVSPSVSLNQLKEMLQ